MPLPDTVEGAARWLLGGVLIFAFGFESVVMLWDGKFLFCLCSFLIAVALTLLLVYWSFLPTIILVLSGIVALASIPFVFYGIVRFIRDRKASKQMLMVVATFLFAVAIIAAIAGVALIYVARTTQSPTIATISQGPPPGENSKVIAAIEAEKNAAILQRDQAVQTVLATKQQLAAAQQAPRYGKKMGPINTLNAFSATGGIWRELMPQDIAILFTASPENNELFLDLHRIFEVGLREVRDQVKPGRSPLLQPPNYQRDLDAPPLAATDLSGIIIHGPVPDSLRRFFENCFVTRWTEKVPEGLANYYKFQRVIWIEIGNGFPWKTPGICSE